MKTLINLISIALFFSCNTTHITHKSKQKINHLDILLEFNQSQYVEFGIPTKNILPNNQFIDIANDTFKIKNDSVYLRLFVNENECLFFLYKEDGYKVEGQFHIPSFSEIGYKRVINPETFISDTISFYDYKRPIRQGKWLYDNNGTITNENYNIIIDHSRIRN